MINEDQWTNKLKDIIEESFKIIILPNILPTEDELENPQEFVYYYYDCIDERKSKTQKNLIFALMEELFVKQPDFLEFYIRSLDYLIHTSTQNLQVDINYLNYNHDNLSIFSVLQKNTNLIKAYLISLTNSAFQIGDRVDLLELIEITLKYILETYLNQNLLEDKDEILSLFCLFFTYSSDFIFSNNDSFYKNLLHQFVQILNQNNLSQLLELQIYFMFEKIIDENRIQIFISNEIPILLETMINKINRIELQEFYKLLNKLFSFCSTKIIQDVIESFVQQILQLIQTQSNDLILGNCLEVLKSLLNLNHRNNQASIFYKIDIYIQQFLKIIIEKKQNLFKEPLLDIFLIVLKKSNLYLESFQIFQQNLLQIFQNIETQNSYFQIILYLIRKFQDKLIINKQNISQLIEIIISNLKFDDIFKDQNILLLGYLFSLNLFNQDQTVRLFNFCFKELVSSNQYKQSIYIAACVFLKIAQVNYEGVEQFLLQNNVQIQKFFQQMIIIFIDKIKPSLHFLNNWISINVRYLENNIQSITQTQFQNFLINCLLLNLIYLNQTSLFLEEKDQILFILKQQFSNDTLYQQLIQAYNLDYNYDDLSGIEDEKLNELEDIGANLGKFPDHTLQNLTNELLSLNNNTKYDSFEQMRLIIQQLESQQDYQEIYNLKIDENFKKLIKNTKSLHTFTKEREYSVRKIIKLKRKKNNQFRYINQPKDGKGSLSPMENNFIIIYNFQQILKYGGDEY